ncbi:recombinase family protein [Enterococcus sp. LJL128]
MKVAIYTRVSSYHQAEEGHSLDAQKKILIQYAESRLWTISSIYTDEGISGKNTVKRLGFQKMLSDARSKKFDIILVWKLSRFSRNLRDLVLSLEDLNKWGVSLVSYSEHFDLSTPTGKLMFNVIGAFAEFERETIAENVRMGKQEAVIQGGRSMAFCLGYHVENNDFIVNAREARLVNEIYDMYLEVKCISKVTEFLNDMGYRGLRGKKFRFNSIRIILTNVSYTGFSRFKGSIPCKYKTIPQIISESKYDEVQGILKSKAKGNGLFYKTVEEWLQS